MTLLVRLVRAMWIFGLVFVDYLSQLGLVELVGEVQRDRDGREFVAVPGWVKSRRARLDERNAERLYRGMVELHGVFIKLGQVLSIMGGFLPRVYQRKLERLQDQVPSRPFGEVRKVFLDTLGRSPEECFESIEESPIAAASLGQVHVAWLRDEHGQRGEKVAVKVLYPGIREVIRVDMQVIRLAVIVYQWFVPVSGLDRVYVALTDLLARETDYVHEARCMARMSENFVRDRDILFPSVVHEFSSRDILTMTFMEGTKINRLEDLRAQGIDVRSVATRFVEAFYKMLFVDRLFHADPHPGNFLVQPGRTPRRPKIVVLDFGAVSEVHDGLIDGMLEVIGGVLEEDGDKLLRGFYAMGFASREANRQLLERTVATYFERLLRIKDRTPAALMRANSKELEALVDPEVARDELRELMRSVEYPEGWFYVERAAVLAFWLVGQLDPEVDAMQVGYPYVMPLIEAARGRHAAADDTATSEDSASPEDTVAAEDTASPGVGGGTPHAVASSTAGAPRDGAPAIAAIVGA